MGKITRLRLANTVQHRIQNDDGVNRQEIDLLGGKVQDKAVQNDKSESNKETRPEIIPIPTRR